MAGLGDAPIVQKLAVPAVSLLVFFLGYTSQFLFHTARDLGPGPPSRNDTLVFNVLLLCLWYTYYKSCTVDPGRYTFASRVLEIPDDEVDKEQRNGNEKADEQVTAANKKRWCRKCVAPKPPRAHHCRTCARCVPKMDHHCPWTTNCVSLTTFPHFLRFLLFTNLALWHLSYQIFLRFAALWRERFLPAYLGPSLPSLIHLSLLAIIDFFTCLALGIMLGTTVRNWIFNMTTIEGWESERHEELVNKIWWEDGEKRRCERVEFPYDLGFFANLSNAMGSRNPLVWVFPFSGNPAVAVTEGKGTGWQYEENGFNRMEGMWPPPDPDRTGGSWTAKRQWPGARNSTGSGNDGARYESPADEIAAFRKRQEEDLRRRKRADSKAKLMAELEELDMDEYEYDFPDEDSYPSDGEETIQPAAKWTNSEGERLRDFGVDEDEDGDEQAAGISTGAGNLDQGLEDVPLAELIRRRKGFAQS